MERAVFHNETPDQRFDRETYWDRLEAAREGRTYHTESPAQAARRRSKELFESVLTPEQLAFWKANWRFQIIGGKTGKIYTISRGHSFNISTGNVRYCAGATDVPPYDRLVSQKLWLESEGELEFLEKANVR